jgi:hypothetical protein
MECGRSAPEVTAKPYSPQARALSKYGNPAHRFAGASTVDSLSIGDRGGTNRDALSSGLMAAFPES